MSNLESDIKKVLEAIQESQWNFKPDFDYLSNYKIMTREDLRKVKMDKGYFKCTTSGSTGESVSVEKTYTDLVWYAATNIREFIWRKWDTSKNYAIIRPDSKVIDINNWGLPRSIFPNQGKVFKINYAPISKIQTWLEEKNPNYIHCLPSIFKQLDLSKVTNFIDHKGTGEVGGSMFSSEECGTIAITCPDNPSVYHVMENHIVEVDSDGGMIITTMTNPYIKRYKNGDCIELGTCNCGRTLQTIKKINGRIRNMFVLPNGDKKWPLIGSRDYYDKFGIKKYKAIQLSINELELQIISEPLKDKEKDLIKLIQQWLESDINVTIKYVDSFPNYKFEEFVSNVKI